MLYTLMPHDRVYHAAWSVSCSRLRCALERAPHYPHDRLRVGGEQKQALLDKRVLPRLLNLMHRCASRLRACSP
jgi:hypothetical protein